MNKTGAFLKQAREKNGISLNEVSMSLKISIRVLSAIEDGDQKSLPSITFLRGFIKSYSTFLKINPEEVLQIFNEENGISPTPVQKSPETAPQEVKEEPQKSDRLVSENMALRKNTLENSVKNDAAPTLEKSTNKASLVFSAIAFVAIVGIVLVSRLIEKYQREAEIPTPTNIIAKIDAAPETKAEPATAAPVDSAVPTTPTQQMSSTPIMSQAPRSEAPTTKPSTTAAPATPTPAPVTADAEKPKPEEKKPSKKTQELIVEALDAVTIEIVSPNGKTEKIQLAPEEVHIIRAKSGFKVSISNGGAANLTLNGKDLGVPGSAGSAISLSY